MKIVIAGGSGFLGAVLCTYFNSKHDLVVLSRSGKGSLPEVKYVKWDGKAKGDWVNELNDAHVLINMVGRTVDCRYNEKNKREILESRIDATTILGEAVLTCSQPPKLWINSASATVYRHAEDREMNETTGELGHGFSVDVCKAWEQCFFNFNLTKTRQVAIRTSIVLGKTGGAVKPLINLARLGLGGRQGSGRQFFSWIHEVDFARAVEFIIQHENLNGPVNVVAPKPIRNKDLMKLMRQAVKMPFGIPMPIWMLEIGARIIRTETELILKSRNVIPEKLIRAGFDYKYPDLQSALKEIV